MSAPLSPTWIAQSTPPELPLPLEDPVLGPLVAIVGSTPVLVELASPVELASLVALAPELPPLLPALVEPVP